MKKFLSVLLAASLSLTMSYAVAETATPAPKKTVKKAVKKPAKKAAAAKDADDAEPDVTGSIVREFNCADGHKVTVYRNPNDDNNVALRWNNRIIRMKHVVTQSGAERLEHEGRGLLFIGIPAKAMLLDSKKGRQLANDCKMEGQ